ncbi:UPF0223 family protein [Facklamia miroungae]|uniref:Uncharacterized protein YktA, UPF0223 family n=1 Tax=Facklamia miroungae TaxID=120956 RepID=A0A1G7U542_9LACT|nr:UPF0223 family protein [Facklamia miroungae]NKZ29909.1 UPF0223 family protein [Facklamia miroungae]SDG42371.1 Uncharacterized protein YktA, UPF0223 family [Facklamia miroungae]
MSNYSYPLNEDWSSQEIAIVVEFLAAVESAYETGIKVERIKDKYRAFKEIVNSISEEKQIDREFQTVSGYSIYRCMQKAKTLKESQTLKMP